MTQLTRILQKRSNCCGISHVPLILQTCPGLIEFWYDIHAAVIIAVGAIEIAHMFDLNIHGICKRIRGVYLVHINCNKITTHKSMHVLWTLKFLTCIRRTHDFQSSILQIPSRTPLSCCLSLIYYIPHLLCHWRSLST